MNLTGKILTELQLLSSGGGWFFWVLIILAFGIAYSLISLRNALRFPDAILLSAQDWRQLLHHPSSVGTSMERLREKLAATSDPGRYLQEIGQHLFSKQDRRFPFAFVMIGVAPLIGLLGTVSGMLKTFGGMASDASVAPLDVITGGISEALITTQTGLVIGVPTFIVCSWFKSRHDDLLRRFRRLESQLLQENAAPQP